MSSPRYVRDKEGRIWMLVDSTEVGNFGLLVNADGTVLKSPLANLLNKYGPLHILSDLGDDVLDRLPVIRQVCDHSLYKQNVKYHGPYGEGTRRHMRSKQVCSNCGETTGLAVG